MPVDGDDEEAPPLANDGGDEHAEFGSGVDEAASDPPSSDEGAVNEEVESEVDEAACDPPSSDEGAVKVELKSELDEAASDPSSDEGALPHDSGDEAGSDPTSSDEGAPAARNPPSHAAVCESESGHEESESVGSDDEMDNPPFAEGVAQPTRKCSTKKEKLKKYWEQFKVGTFQEKIALERARNGLASSSTPAPGLCRPIARSESVDSPESSSSATLILGQHTSSERPRLHRSKPIEFEALDGRDAEMSPTSLPTPRGDGGSDGEESDSDDSASMPSLAGPGEFESMLVEASNNMHCKAGDRQPHFPQLSMQHIVFCVQSSLEALEASSACPPSTLTTPRCERPAFWGFPLVETPPKVDVAKPRRDVVQLSRVVRCSILLI